MTNGLMESEFAKKKADPKYLTQMEQISTDIMTKEDMDNFNWMSNEKYTSGKRRGGFTLPMDSYYTPNQKGINSLKAKNTCAVLTSLKMDNTMLAGIEDVFGHTSTEVFQQMELEMISQNLYRGVIRDWSSTERMTVYVYDERQAMSIQGAGSYDYIDLGFERKQAGRTKSSVPHNIADASGRYLKRGERNLSDVLKWLNHSKRASLSTDGKSEILNMFEKYNKQG